MEFQMSSASASSPAAGARAPGVAEPLVAPRPRIVPPRRGRPWRSWVFVLILLGLVAGAIAYWKLSDAGKQTAQAPQAPIVRVATVGFGDLQQVIRVTGVVAAERFAAINAPRLSGSRRDRGRSMVGNASTTVSS